MGESQIYGAHAFLFNADTPEFGGYYGDPCNKALFDAMLEYNSVYPIVSRIYSGDILLFDLCKLISEVERAGDSTITTYAVDKNLYLTLLTELSQSLEEQTNTFNVDNLLLEVGTHNIYCIVITNLSYSTRMLIDATLQKLNGYIGMLELDIKNPLHVILFVEQMINHGYLKETTLFLEEEFINEEEIVPNWAKGHSKIDIKILASNDFKRQAPPLIIPHEVSPRGERFQKIVTLKGKTDHYQKISEALLENESTDFHYIVNGKLSYAKITVPEDKLTKYALNFEHEKGGKEKARQFKELLGIEAKDWRYLAAQIENGLADGKICNVRKTEFGIQYHIDIPIIGLNGVSKTVRTAWLTKENGENQLTTLYVAKQKEQQGRLGTEPNLVNLSKPDIFWKALYDLAHTEAKKSSENHIATPMFIEGYPPILEGVCGFAWIVVKDARKGFAKWLKDNHIGSKYYRGGWEIFADCCDQSYEKAKRYAETFEKVLKQNGVECYFESRLD